MKEYKEKKLFQILFVFLMLFGAFLIYMGFNNIKNIIFNYKEDSKINYKVYLKPNQFFNTPYLEENKTYIASLIDYIDVNFDYTANYSNKISGDVQYKYTILLSANKTTGDGYYWQKEYDLSELKNIKLDESNQLNISDNFKVEYAKYNSLLNKFKKEYNLTTDGELKVVLNIYNKSIINEANEPLELKSDASLSIPLLERALEISINKDTENNNKTITIKQEDDGVRFSIYKILGGILIISSIIGFIKVTKERIEFKNQNEYELKLRRILDSYDSIIANVNTIPSFDESKRIILSTFNELLDVYNEVRMPINYYQNTKDLKSTFFIINDDVVWIYVLKNK